jgi:hypothetical protein
VSASPLLMLDVDGVLTPTFAWNRPEGYKAFAVRRSELGKTAKRYSPLWLNPRHGVWLGALDTEIRWATAWEAAANAQIGRHLGMVKLPHVSFSRRDFRPQADGSHWKLDDIMANADGRPFVWVDDGVSGADVVRVQLEYPAPALLYRVDPRRGLTWNDMSHVWGWLNAVS